MRLDLTEILNDVGKNIKYTVEEPPLVDEDIECTEDICGDLRFTNAGSTLLIKGTLKTALVLPCSRCPEYFEQPLELKVEEQFEIQRLGGSLRSQQQITLLEEDENPVAAQLFEGTVLDLTEMIRQYLFLETPMRPVPVCDAKGNCLQCHKKPEEVLEIYAPKPEEATNAPFAQLAQMLEEKEEK